jgi:hypothetical protein
MNLTLGAGDEESGRPLLGGQGAASDGQGTSGARGGAGMIFAATLETIARVAQTIASGGVSGAGCAWDGAVLPSGKTIGSAEVGDALYVLSENGDCYAGYEVRSIHPSIQPCVRIVSESGIALTCSTSTPITTWRDGTLIAIEVEGCVGAMIPVLDQRGFRWEEIVSCEPVGDRPVRLLSCDDATYAAGDEPGRYLFTHNAKDYI